MQQSNIACSPKVNSKQEHNHVSSKVISNFLTALKSCRTPRDLPKGKLLHADVVCSGLASNIYLANTLLSMYAKCGSMVDAARVFAGIRRPNVVSWNSLILGYAENGQGELALLLFGRIERGGFQPNGRTLVAALKACTTLAVEESKFSGEKSIKKVMVVSLEKCMFVHALAAERGFAADIFVSNTLIDAYAKCGSMPDSWRVFCNAEKRDFVTWNALIQGFTDCGEGDRALELLCSMQEEQVAMDSLSFTAGLKACAGLAEKEEGREIDGKVVKMVSLEKTMILHVQAAKMEIDSKIIVANTLVDTYAKCGSVADASKAFDRINKPDLVLWNTLLMAHAENDEGESALDFFSQLTDEIEPDARSFIAALKACGNLVALSSARVIHALVCKLGLERNEIVSCCLLDSYARCGSMLDAQQVFDSVSESDSVLWTALLSGYCREGNTRLVFETFRQSIEQGFRANSVTFVCLLTACSHAGIVDTGRAYFRSMQPVYGVEPGPEHYLCLVDLLGRGNRLEEAVEVMESMPVEATVGHWMTILGACKKWKNAAVGKLAFEKVVELDERDPAAYSLMLTIYGSLGMWKEMPRVYNLRTKVGASSRPGLSWWIDEAGSVHKFVAGDVRHHPDRESIRRKLRELEAEMRNRGYVADLASVAKKASDAEKESSLCGHSERLAIACALVNSAPGKTIRIAKNLRVCDDCHAATGLISMIEKRVIVCRDSSRFHSFSNGTCSCGEFW